MKTKEKKSFYKITQTLKSPASQIKSTRLFNRGHRINQCSLVQFNFKIKFDSNFFDKLFFLESAQF